MTTVPFTAEHFKRGSDAKLHRAVCTDCGACFPRTLGETLPGPRGASRVRIWSRNHVETTGHTVRIDTVTHHGYQPKQSV